MSQSELEYQWAQLEAGSDASNEDIGVSTLRTGVVTAAGPVRVALCERGRRCLLIPISMTQAVGDVVATDVLGVTTVTLASTSGPQRFLRISCDDDEVAQAFADLSASVLRRLEAGQNAVAAFADALEAYRHLLRRSRAWTQERAIGLAGELNLLLRLVKLSPASLLSWVGPRGARHDFSRSGQAIEVKSTLVASRLTVGIASIHQLLEPEGGSLYLIHTVFERASNGVSATDIVGQIRRCGVDGALLNDLLAAVAYDEGDDALQRVKLTETSTTMYQVRDGFPRIVPQSLREGALPAGTSSLRYEVDLGAAAAFRVVPEQETMLCGRMAGL
jgi:hypothetical protein